MSEKEKINVLGKTFDSDEERRAYFREELRKKLPELRTMEGFPLGEDEDILNLSDPPYYTACPNPWLNEFIAEWEKEKPGYPGRNDDSHVTEPYASDVKEGKNNPIYNAHSYHTKVPHPAIMRYILHYTQPGDIVLDGFAGTGMTGVAAQLCGKPDIAIKTKIENEWRTAGKGKPVWGPRKAILGDLSPIASFIAYNYNTPVDVAKFGREARRILKEVEEECGWMYLTLGYDNHSKNKEARDAVIQEAAREISKASSPEEIRAVFDQFRDPRSLVSLGKINYTVWSDVFTCSDCGGEIVFWDAAVDHQAKRINKKFYCPHCRLEHTKRSVDKTLMTYYDKTLGKTIRKAKTLPVLINYSMENGRSEKNVDAADFAIIHKIEDWHIPNWFPSDAMMGKGRQWGDTWRAGVHNGITHVHHFYTKRNLLILGAIRDKCSSNTLTLLFNTQLINISKLNRYRPGVSFPYNPLSGTLYIASQVSESNIFTAYRNKLKRLVSAFQNVSKSVAIFNSSMSDLRYIQNESVDYIFTDPPFGKNLMYSELNYLWESWLKVRTNNSSEAIQNNSQGKGFEEYIRLMTECFEEYYRVLKPGRWMTVEFSNTSAGIWNGIHTALQRAGFVIANVAALDKKQGSFKAVTTPTAVKQDLIISCYKPSEAFMRKFQEQSDPDTNIWEFVREHLDRLPIHVAKGDATTPVIERTPKILYDRVITFFIMHNLPIPIDARDFHAGLETRFAERDRMYFTEQDAARYETRKAETRKFEQITFVVSDESEGIRWLRNKLSETPLTYQEIQPEWMKAIGGVRKGDILPELRDILSENFIEEKHGKWRVPDMNEQKDRDAMRTKSLLRIFETYKAEIQKSKGRLKQVRAEALRAGFRHCWNTKDYQTIAALGERIPRAILEQDEILLMYYDIAKDKVG